MRLFLLGAAVGALAMGAKGYLLNPFGVGVLETAAMRYANETGSVPVWLIERSGLALVPGDNKTVLFFGYPDNGIECERLVEVYSLLDGMSDALCAEVE